MKPLMFYSTNRRSPEIDIVQALITGQAPDKGLYMPKNIPKLTPKEIQTMKGQSYAKVAEQVLAKYVKSTILEDCLKELCEDAYNFDVPIEHITERRYIMRLDQGPTGSFKDFAARMMGRMFGVLRKDAEQELVILTATSGDTGSAVANAFYGIANIQVMVLFPLAEVSTRQRKQMTTLGKNITIVGINGKFDDCQALVKKAFADKTLGNMTLSSANSINIGRLLPQIVYYVYAYTQLTGNKEEIIFSIPSGNFGNMMGAVLAKKMDLPISRIVVSTNANNEVPEYLKSGIYKKIVPSIMCISNAMNVGHPSNFARVIDIYGGRMDETGIIHQPANSEKMRKELWAISIGEEETRNTIRAAWENYHLLLEPHGAVGWAGLEHFIAEEKPDELMVSIETAHPAKFPEEIEQLLSFSPKIPRSIAEIENKKEIYLTIENDYNTFLKLLIEKYRV
jgi:threonine synthase